MNTRTLVLLLVTAWPAVWTPGHAGDALETTRTDRAFRIGLLPHLSPDILMETYQPLLDYLEDTLERPVVAVTAPDFKSYVERSGQGRYDLFLTAPHLAALAKEQHRSRQLARFSKPLYGVIVVALDAPYNDIADLRGKRMTTPDPMAVITMLSEVALRQHGITPHTDIELTHANTHNSAILTVINGQADAAVAGVSAYGRMPEDIRLGLRIIGVTESIPHMIFMANPNLPDEEYRKAKNALLQFTANGAGTDFFAGHGRIFADIAPVSDQDMITVAKLLPLLTHSDIAH